MIQHIFLLLRALIFFLLKINKQDMHRIFVVLLFCSFTECRHPEFFDFLTFRINNYLKEKVYNRFSIFSIK